MELCDECGYGFDEHLPPAIVGEIAAVGLRLAARIRSIAASSDGDTVLRTRPSPLVWSALEYACHVRDVLLIQRDRLFLALVEETPAFVPMHRDERAAFARYNSRAVATVATELEVAAELCAEAFSFLDGAEWGRTCLYQYPAPAERDLVWLAQNTLHEGEHHLFDVERVLGSLDRSVAP